MPLPPGLTRDELIDEVVHAWRRVRPPLAETQTIERDGWHQLITPSLKQGGLNEVSWSVLRDDEADAVIDATIAQYRDQGVRFRWTVAPGTKPDDLAERLERRGFTRHEIHGVARDLSPIDERPGTTRVELAGAATVDEYTDVMGEGWSMDSALLRPLHRAMVERAGSGYRLFIAREGVRAVGVAAYLVVGRAAHQMGAVVLPGFRGRGAYHALIAARIADAASHGLVLATSHARAATSAPILEKLGFETVCRFPSLSSPPW